jgi:hypothetical protein
VVGRDVAEDFLAVDAIDEGVAVLLVSPRSFVLVGFAKRTLCVCSIDTDLLVPAQKALEQACHH